MIHTGSRPGASGTRVKRRLTVGRRRSVAKNAWLIWPNWPQVPRLTLRFKIVLIPTQVILHYGIHIFL
jgi:hypothetical protein